MSDKYITLDNLSTFKGKLDDEFNKKQDVITRNQGNITSVLGLDNSDEVVDGSITSSLISSESATSGKVLTANGSGGAAWQPVIPSVVIALSQIVSQDPLEVQLTDAQYNIFANNKQVILDLSALGESTVVWKLQIDESSYMCFGFVSAGSGTTLDSNLIDINKSTKVVTYYNNTIAGGGMSNPMTSVGDLIVGSDSTGTPTRLAKGSNGQVLGINNGSVAWVNEATPSEISYLTTAPSSANTSGNLKFVVLSSDPSQKYSGYIYIITGSN